MESSSTAIDLPPNTHLEPAGTFHSTPLSSTPVEMTNLNPTVAAQDPIETRIPATTPDPLSAAHDSSKENERPSSALPTTTTPSKPLAVSSSPPTINSPISAAPSPTSLIRQQIAPAIGPATDKPTPIPKESAGAGPFLMITLLLNTGARHPYRIDEKYLKKRNVSVAGNDPVNMSVYTLKELIWRDWREEWEARPSSPSSIRLIHFGKLLDDKAHLKDGRFESGPTPHVVHMTIKPQEIVDEEDAKTGKSGGRDRNGNERSPGCRCLIM
ncbi:Ubiquitin-related domain [Lasallia pustulata]|uniref:Ubiquitin-related domain n=1 Tax=Lasallia pustulata TaxID=136370 RepID=A0A1W5D038_9LECA|nr:Ubiquitin-related domain [Lasallia pustulata]